MTGASPHVVCNAPLYKSTTHPNSWEDCYATDLQAVTPGLKPRSGVFFRALPSAGHADASASLAGEIRRRPSPSTAIPSRGRTGGTFDMFWQLRRDSGLPDAGLQHLSPQIHHQRGGIVARQSAILWPAPARLDDNAVAGAASASPGSRKYSPARSDWRQEEAEMTRRALQKKSLLQQGWDDRWSPGEPVLHGELVAAMAERDVRQSCRAPSSGVMAQRR